MIGARILGCDPGLTGALALLQLDRDRRVVGLDVRDMPVTRIKVGRASRNQIDPADLMALIRWLKPDIAWVEVVHSMPNQGVAASFSFGMGYGVLLTSLAALAVPTNPITPQEWQRIVRLGRGDDIARQRVAQLLPQHTAWFPLKGHHGRADATLIALAGAQIEKHAGL